MYIKLTTNVLTRTKYLQFFLLKPKKNIICFCSNLDIKFQQKIINIYSILNFIILVYLDNFFLINLQIKKTIKVIIVTYTKTLSTQLYTD